LSDAAVLAALMSELGYKTASAEMRQLKEFFDGGRQRPCVLCFNQEFAAAAD
jgi:hypothetical protein